MLNALPLPSTNLVSGTGGFLPEPDLALERRGDARADAARRVGVDLQVLLDSSRPPASGRCRPGTTRAAYSTWLVFECATKKPPSGSGPS